MSSLPAKYVGKQLSKAGRLNLRTLCVYSPIELPPGTVRVCDLVKEGNRCLARAILLVAAGAADAVGVSEGSTGVCAGAMGFLGFSEVSEQGMIDTAASGEQGAFLFATPAICRDALKSMGRITPPGKHVVVSSCEAAGDIRPMSYLCLGRAERIRNLCGLVYFRSGDAFGQIDAPWGTACEMFITYPAGLASGAPGHTAFIGPIVPDGNSRLPADIMAMSIPADVAERMAADVDDSFIVRRPDLAYPVDHDPVIERALNRSE